MNEKVLGGPKFGTLLYRKWVTNIWVVTSHSLAICGNPFPKLMRGRRTSVLLKEGRLPLRKDLIPISELLARLSWFFYLRPVRAL
jgi:hypothetical protein